MRRNPEFTRRFNELTAGETQTEVALKIGVTPSYVGQIKRGVYVPSREVVERLIEAYHVNREEWLALAGYGRKAGEENVQELLRQAVHHGTRLLNGAQRLAQGLFELAQEFQRPIPVYLHQGADSLTVEEADRILAELRRQLENERDRERRARDPEEPIRLDRPPS